MEGIDHEAGPGSGALPRAKTSARVEGPGPGPGEREDSLELHVGEVTSLKMEAKRASLMDALYGVMYTLLKEKKEQSWKLEMLDVAIHFVQLYLLVYSQTFHWDWGLQDSHRSESVIHGVELAEIVNLLEALGYQSFLVVYWVLFSALALSLICAWVAQNFKTGKFPFIWPIKLARVFVGFFFKTLDITSLSVFIMALSCQIHPPPGEPSHNRIYPDKRCDRAPHLFILVFAVPFAALTITIGWLLAAGTTEMDPLNRELMAVPFPEASTKIFVAVTGIDVLSVFLRGHGRTFGVTTALLSGYILYVLLRWIPYYTRWVNRLMCAMYTGLFFAALCLTALETVPGAHHVRQASIAGVFGVPPAILLGWTVMSARQWIPAQKAAAVLQASQPTAGTASQRDVRPSPGSVTFGNARASITLAHRTRRKSGDVPFARSRAGSIDARAGPQPFARSRVGRIDARAPVPRALMAGPSKGARAKGNEDDINDFDLPPARPRHGALSSHAPEVSVRYKESNDEVEHSRGHGARDPTATLRKWASAAVVAGGRRSSVLLRALFQNERASAAHTSTAEPTSKRVVFASAAEVEIAARVMRERDVHGNLKESNLMAAQRLLAMGLRQFPDSPQLQLFVSHFFLHVGKNHQKSSAQLQRARQLPMSLGLRFQVFCRDREAMQAGADSGLGAEGAMDLVTYVEFQNNFQAAQRSHTQALRATREFWRGLLRTDISFESLTSSASRISELALAAAQVFRTMLRQHPSNVKLLRAHGRFVSEVANDPWRATQEFEKADRIEDRQAEARRVKLLTEVANASKNPLDAANAEGEPGTQHTHHTAATLSGHGGAGSKSVVDTIGLDENVNDNKDAVIVITETGIVLMTNRLFNKMFRYKTGELEGVNVSALMPAPFSQQHNGYLRQYMSSQQARLSKRSREVVALDKSRGLFPIKIRVTPLPQPGGGCHFIGVIHKLEEQDLSKGELWLTQTGAVLCCSPGFERQFGWTSADLAGKGVEFIAAGEGGAAKAEVWGLEVARAVSSVTQALELGTEDEHASVEDYEGSFEAVLRHKWSRQSLHVQCAVRLAGTETTPVVVVTVEIDDVDCSACLASNLDGQLKYASAGAEKLLGYVPGTMLSKSMTVEQIIPGPGGHLHAALVRGFFLKGESVPPDVPCAHGHIVSLRSKKGSLVPVRMRWKAHRAGSETTIVTTLMPVQRESLKHPWGISDRGAFPDRQICLRLLVAADGTIAAATDGFGFSAKGRTGSVFGINGDDLVGKTADAVVSMMDAVVGSARQYNSQVTSQEILASFLPRLAQKHLDMGCASYRTGVTCPHPKERGATVTVPGRLVVVPADVYGIDTWALVDAGVLSARQGKDARRGRMYVVECWSANWLTGEVSMNPDRTIYKMDHHLALLTGKTDADLVGKRLDDLFSPPEALARAVPDLKAGAERVGLPLAHFDSSECASSLSVQQAHRGRPGLHALVRGVFEEADKPMHALRRVEMLALLSDEMIKAEEAAIAAGQKSPRSSTGAGSVRVRASDGYARSHAGSIKGSVKGSVMGSFKGSVMGSVKVSGSDGAQALGGAEGRPGHKRHHSTDRSRAGSRAGSVAGRSVGSGGGEEAPSRAASVAGRNRRESHGGVAGDAARVRRGSHAGVPATTSAAVESRPRTRRESRGGMSTGHGARVPEPSFGGSSVGSISRDNSGRDRVHGQGEASERGPGKERRPHIPSIERGSGKERRPPVPHPRLPASSVAASDDSGPRPEVRGAQLRGALERVAQSRGAPDERGVESDASQHRGPHSSGRLRVDSDASGIFPASRQSSESGMQRPSNSTDFFNPESSLRGTAHRGGPREPKRRVFGAGFRSFRRLTRTTSAAPSGRGSCCQRRRC